MPVTQSIICDIFRPVKHKMSGVLTFYAASRLPGLLRCAECGRSLTGEFKKGQYVYYGHACKHTEKRRYLAETTLLQKLETTVLEFASALAFAENLKKIARRAGEQLHRERAAESAEFQDRLAELEKRKSRLYDLFADARVDVQGLARKVEDINQRIESLLSLRGRTGRRQDKSTLAICRTIDDMRDLPVRLRRADAEARTALFCQMIARADVAGDSVRLTYRAPYSLLLRPVVLAALRARTPRETASAQAQSAAAPETGAGRRTNRIPREMGRARQMRERPGAKKAAQLAAFSGTTPGVNGAEFECPVVLPTPEQLRAEFIQMHYEWMLWAQ